MKGTAGSDHLDIVRGLASIAVLAHHTIAVVFAPNDGLLYVLSELGSEPPVVVFFVLSGFLVGGSVVRDTEKQRWSWKGYLTNRLTRLWVVLLPGLLLTALWDQATLALTAGVEPGPAAAAYMSVEGIREGTTATVLFGNVAFLQTIFVPAFGSNAPLWSLAFEWWYYVAFPGLWLAAVAKRPAVRIASGIVGIGALVFAGPIIAAHFILWLFGAGLAFLPASRWLGGSRGRRWGLCVVGMLALAGALTAVSTGVVPDKLLGRIGIAAAFALLLYGLLHDQRPTRNGRYAKASRTLAGFSFTLYLAHMPVLVCVRAAWAYREPWPADALHAGWAVGLGVAIILYSYGIASLTEARTDRVRRWLLGNRSPVPVKLP